MNKLILPFSNFKQQRSLWRENFLCPPELVERASKRLRQAQSDRLITIRRQRFLSLITHHSSLITYHLSLITHHLSLLLLVFCLLAHVSFAQADFSKGTWLKIAVSETGVHRIKASEIKKAGVSTTILSENIRLFGAENGVLPQKNNESELRFLKEIPIEINDSDGDFSADDYLLFYAESPNRVLQNNEKSQLVVEKNPYSAHSYYYLQLADTKGLRMSFQPEETTFSNEVTEFDDLYYFEKEETNLLHSGREWLGDFMTNKQDYTVTIEGLQTTSSVLLNSQVFGAVTSTQALPLKIANQLMLTHTLTSTGYQAGSLLYKYNRRGDIDNQLIKVNLPAENFTLSYDFGTTLPSPSGVYIDFFSIQSKRKIQFYSKQTILRNFDSILKTATKFSFSGANTDGFVWDVTQPLFPKKVKLKQDSKLYFIAKTSDTLRSFVTFTVSSFLSDVSIQKVEISTISFEDVPNLLIVTAPAFVEQANRLAEFRQKNDKLKVKVLTTQAIYDNFSGGKPDPSAIRNVAREFWKKDSSIFKYLLLLGEATFDYKNNAQLVDNEQAVFVPVYESRESYEPIYSYSSDDYFGFLEPTEGEWKEGRRVGSSWDNSETENHTLDIGVGRLPVRNNQQAKQVIDKLIYYENTKTIGDWRTKVTLVADDEDGNIHHRDAINLAAIAEKANPSIFTEKLLLGAFPQFGTANGDRSPEAVTALNKAVEEGSLIINYNGHGSENGWTDEKLLTIEQLIKWRNLNNLPIFLTATCEFGRYDNPSLLSGAELALLNPQGGASALLTTTRPVYSSSNFLLNEAFYTHLKPEIRLGDLIRSTKNASMSGVLNRNFSLLGDPSMGIALPKNEVEITAINGENPGNQQLKALEKVQLTGKINAIEHGKVEVAVFDKPTTFQTKATTSTPAISYLQRSSCLYRGVVEVKNNNFEANFVIPKDIDYQVGKGSMYFYGISSDSLTNVAGNFLDFMVGGSADNFVLDTTPPKVKLSVDAANVLTAEIEDESGINISLASIGHNIQITLNDTLEIIGNPYYKSIENYQKGILIYDFGELQTGKYTVQLKVWDTYNNSTTEALDFVVNAEAWQVSSGIFPNPTDGITNFSIVQTASNKDLQIDMLFFDELGKNRFQHTDYCYYCPNTIEITLDIKTFFLTYGLKFFVVRLTDLTTNQQINTSGKFIFWK